MAKKTKPAKPRDPSWRLRRALKPARIESAKSYRRAAAGRATRDAHTDAADGMADDRTGDGEE